MIRALVVDDEQPAREELRALLEESGGVQVIGEAAHAMAALAAVRRDRPDVVFLDVQMPAVSGLELIGMIEDEILPDIVFVTAHDEFALRAFEENAVDYLLKPVSAERLARTLERLRGRIAPAGRPPLAAAPITRVPCLGRRTIKLVPVPDVEIVKSTLSGVYVVCAHGEYSTDLTLQVLEARAGLLRCHKQFLVNAAAVDEVSLEEPQATVRTRSGHTVPVSRRHLSHVREILGF
jgi:two-component system, LytTR family, response regulator